MMFRFVGVFVIFYLNICFASELSTESPNSIAIQGYSKNTTKDGLSKRGISVENLSRKSYDPPPEYYNNRGPASSSSSPSSTYNANRDSAVAEYSSRPVAFPQENYGFRGGSSGGWSNNGQQERKGQHDRVSVEHYGTSTGTGTGHSAYGEGTNHGYGATSGAHPYGPPKTIEYEYYSPTGNNHGFSEAAEGIPVELYNRGYGGYGHAGEYATYSVNSAHHGGGGGAEGGHVAVGHSNGKHGYDKALLAKSFLIPLASAAVLGIAAALASNPLLLQLGTVSGIGKRKKRELDEKLVMHSRAYRSHRRN